MRFIHIYALCLLCICAGHVDVMAKGKGGCELLGHVVDRASKEHLPFVSIQVKGTSISTTSDSTGHFFLTGLPGGEVTVIAKFIGYQDFERELVLSPMQTTEITIVMVEDSNSLDPVVVSANRSETSRKEAPAIVNVLTPAIFEVTNSSNLAEGLNFLTGLRVENNCQNCGFQQVRINGLDGQYSQILIDSRPVISSLSGVYGIEQIPAGMVERVEVLRGGGSALYGSNAIGGTINIITKEPLYNSGAVSSTITMIDGEAPDISTNVNLSLITNDYRAGVYVFNNIKRRNDFDHNGDGYTELPKLRGTTSGFRGFYKPSKFSKLTVEYHNISEFRRGGNSLDAPPHEADIIEQVDHNINGGGLKYDFFSSDYKHKVSFYTSAQHTERTSFYGGNDFTQPPGETEYGGYGITKDITADIGGQYSCSFDKLWFMPASVVVGLEYAYNGLDDKTPAYDRVINENVGTYSAFFQNEWKNDKLSFLLGGRLDKHTLIDNPIFNPRISVRYSPTEAVGFRAGFSTGFLAPQTFSEDLHVEAASGTVVLIELAPDLDPERSLSYSASIDLYQNFGIWRTNFLVDGFYTVLNDVFVLNPMGIDSNGHLVYEKQNGSGARVGGINLEAKALLRDDLQLQAGFTFQKSRYKEAQMWSESAEPTKQMFRTPDAYGYFTGTLTSIKNLSLSLSGTYTGQMYVQHMAGYIANDTLEKTSDFFDANFKAAYTFNLKGGIQLQLNAGMQNIFSSYQSDFDKGPNRDSGYIYGPNIPRSYFAGLKLML